MTLPHVLELPAAALLVIGGAVACFAGYRWFRTVLAIFGFAFGAMIAIATMSPTSRLAMIVTGVVGGVAGTLILAVAYFIGIALAGDRSAASSVSVSGLWIPYPLVPTPARPWVPAAWLALGLLGTAVQVGLTGRSRSRRKR